jgi:hypothetical protein
MAASTGLERVIDPAGHVSIADLPVPEVSKCDVGATVRKVVSGLALR